MKIRRSGFTPIEGTIVFGVLGVSYIFVLGFQELVIPIVWDKNPKALILLTYLFRLGNVIFILLNIKSWLNNYKPKPYGYSKMLKFFTSLNLIGVIASSIILSYDTTNNIKHLNDNMEFGILATLLPLIATVIFIISSLRTINFKKIYNHIINDRFTNTK